MPDPKPTAFRYLCLPLLCFVSLTLQVMLCQLGRASKNAQPKVSWPWVSHRRALVTQFCLHITLCYLGQQGWRRWGHQLFRFPLDSKLPTCLLDPFAKSCGG